MSLVQAYIYKDFVLVCGDQYAELSDGRTIENFVKVRKVSSTTIIGMTGTIEGNAKLFSEFINYDFTLKNISSDMSYNEVCTKISDSYYENYDYLQIHSVHSIICGWDGTKMTGKSFFTQSQDSEVDGIHDLTPKNEYSARIINCGLDLHNENAIKFGKEVNIIDIPQMKNLFIKVIDTGVEFDHTINKNLSFENVRKVDVI